MKNKLSHKLTLAIVTLAVGGIILTGLLTNLALEWNFRRYLRSTQEEQNRRIVETVTELYGETATWQVVQRTLWQLGATTGTQIRVFDTEGGLVADSLPGMMRGMHGRRWQSAQEQRGNTYDYTLNLNNRPVGTVEITHLGREGLWSGEALLFRRAVNQAGILTSLAMIVTAAFVGNILSRRLSSRFKTLTAAAEKLGSSRFETRVSVEGDDELAVLGETMNRMAARLEEQTALRKKLTGDISHELRTPLTTVRSFLEAFRDGVMHPDTRNLQAVLEETDRLGRLVNDLQELAGAEARDRKVELSELDLNLFVQQETERVLPLFRQKGINLTFEHCNCEIKALAEETSLARVLQNLLVNAYKYTPEGGAVSVAVFAAEHHNGFSVADTGVGIDAEHLPYIFERFYRADPSRTRATGGSGIGLAIVLELMQAMGGAIDVESTPGEGTVFTVTLKKA